MMLYLLSPLIHSLIFLFPISSSSSRHNNPLHNPQLTQANTHPVALCGLTPILFIAYTTAPFVTHIHIHLPPQARTSRAVLERFVAKSLPPSTRLTLTTMSPIAKPRYSDIPAGELAPARARLGIVNYVRGHGAAADENESRRWYMFRAVRQFYVQERGEEKKVRYQKKAKSMVDGWIWDAIKGKIAQKDAAAKTV